MKVCLLPPNCRPDEIAACLRGDHHGHHRITPSRAREMEKRGEALALDDDAIAIICKAYRIDNVTVAQFSRKIWFECRPIPLKIPEQIPEQRGSVPRAKMPDEETMLAALPVHLGGKEGPAGDAARLKINSFDAESIAIAGVVYDLHDLYFFGTELVLAQPQEDVHFDDHSIWYMCKPLVVLVRLLHPEISTRVREYMKLRWEPRGHMPTEYFGRFLKGPWQRQLAAANELLDKLWPDVALQFVAGVFSQHLNNSRGSELPPVLAHRVLRTYLRERKSELEF